MLTTFTHMRRATTMVFTTIFVAAIIGPACLAFASSAFAMPMSAALLSGCEDSPGDMSVSSCPHQNPLEAAQAVGQNTPLWEVSRVVSAVFVGPDGPPRSFLRQVRGDAHPPPLARPTPLRL